MTMLDFQHGSPIDWDAFLATGADNSAREERNEAIRAGYSNDQLMLPLPDLSWRPFATAPGPNSSNTQWFKVLHPTTEQVHRIHYAEDLSGDEQPPFKGYFEARGGGCRGFVEIGFEPKLWREIASG